jgi:hypothetical protein
MSGSMTQEWRELIEFEVQSRKDEHFVLDWVLGSRYIDLKYDPDWIVSWEGDIYKGKSGYYEAVHKMELLLQIRPEMNDWEIDLWKLCREYAKVYIGDEARQVASSNLPFFDKLQYMASKKTSDEYEKVKKEYKESLLHPTNRTISLESKEKPSYTKAEKELLINSYFLNDPFSFTPPSLFEVMKGQPKKWKNNLKEMDILTILRYLMYLIIFIVNLIAILYIETQFQADVGLSVIGVEVVLLFFFSITPSDGQVNLSTDDQAISSVMNTSTLNQNAISANNASITAGLWYFAYGVLLLSFYRIFAF